MSIWKRLFGKSQPAHSNVNLQDSKEAAEQKVQEFILRLSDKRRAHALAQKWWMTPHAQSRTSAKCDRCTREVSRGGGCLCEPMQLVSLSGKSDSDTQHTNAWLAD